MFIRKITKRNGSTNKNYTYLHLVESVRTKNGPRQRLVLNLGSLDIPSSQYKNLANAIEAMLTGQSNLFPTQDSSIEKHASEAVDKILDKQSTKKTTTTFEEPSLAPTIERVDIDSIAVPKSRTIGAEHVCHSFWERLEISSFLKSVGFTDNQIPLMEAIVLGRLISPGSERHTYNWVEKLSGIYDLIDAPIQYSSRSFYRAVENLYSHKDALEMHLNKSERDLFSLKESMCFFDLTNTFLEGKADANPMAKRGKSKEKRSDCKLLTLALIVDENGFSKYSHLYDGNQGEAATLPEMVEQMAKVNPQATEDRTVVMDAGIASEDNILYLKENGYRYIVVGRGKSIFTSSDMDNFSTIRENNNGDIEVEVTRKNENGEAFILCRSAGRKKKEEAIRTRQENLFTEKIEYLKDGLIQKGRTKNFIKVTETIGRLREKYPKASKVYKVEVVVEKSDKKSDTTKLNAIDIKIEKKQIKDDAKGLDGCYVLRSDRTDLTDKEIWETYVMLTQIENAFRCMKSTLGLRPIYHKKENSSSAHMFVSVVAYHILHAIEYSLKQNGDNRNWATIRESLSTHQFITLEYNQHNEDMGQIHKYIKMCTKPEPHHCDIYKKIGISNTPINKMKICSDEKIIETQ
jgi:transposase